MAFEPIQVGSVTLDPVLVGLVLAGLAVLALVVLAIVFIVQLGHETIEPRRKTNSSANFGCGYRRWRRSASRAMASLPGRSTSVSTA